MSFILRQLKTAFSCLLLSMLVAYPAMAHKQSPETYQIVFQMTAGTPEQWEGLLGNIDNMQMALGSQLIAVEVVVYGTGLGLVLASNTKLAQRMEAMSKRNVRFVACENTMRRKGISKKDLLPFVGVVDSGVAQIVRRQKQGWQLVHIGQ